MQSLELLAMVASDMKQEKVEHRSPNKNEETTEDIKPEDAVNGESLLPNCQEPDTSRCLSPETTVVNQNAGSPAGRSKPKRKRSKAPPGKPPYSYVALITMAITSTPQRKMTLSQINKFIADHFPYYVTCPLKWRNAIRHNLTLNDCFIKLPRDENSPETTKAHFWTVDPASETMFVDGSFRRRRKRFIRDHDLNDILPSLVELRTNAAAAATITPPLFHPYTPPPSPNFLQHRRSTSPGYSVQDILAASRHTTATDVLVSPYIVRTQPAPRFQIMTSNKPSFYLPPAYQQTLSIPFHQSANPPFRILT